MTTTLKDLEKRIMLGNKTFEDWLQLDIEVSKVMSKSSEAEIKHLLRAALENCLI